jgi:hypothetical protein
MWRTWRCNQPLSILNFSIAALLVSEIHFRDFSELGVANLTDLIF